MDACEGISFISRLLVWAARAAGWTAVRLMFRFESYVLAPALIALWRRTDKQNFLTRSDEARVNINALTLEPDQFDVLMAETQSKRRVNIGEFDQDGFLLSKVGRIRGIPCVTTKDFVPRTCTTLRLLLLDDSVVVEKDFRGMKSSFVRELTALQRLNAAGCRVPTILDVNFKNCSFTMPFIKGMVLREALAKAGAVLRDRDVVAHPAYRGLSPRLMELKRIEAGRNVLANVVSEDFVDRLYRRLQQIHRAGVAHLDMKYGNIVIEEGSNEPRIIDFGSASPICDCGKILFRLLRQYDTEQFNFRFGTHYRAHDTDLGTSGLQHSGQQLATDSVVEGTN